MDKRNYIAINVYYKRSDNLCNFIARSQTANNSSDVVRVFLCYVFIVTSLAGAVAKYCDSYVCVCLYICEDVRNHTLF